MTFREIWRSGDVTRYHARPEVKSETLAAHHCRVAQIICELYHPAFPPTRLLVVALHHDVAELIVGDLPYPFKVAHPAISAAHAKVESAELTRILRQDIDLSDELWAELKLADRIAAYLYAAPQDQANRAWMTECKAIVKAAGQMGFGKAIWRILDAIEPEPDPEREAVLAELARLGQEQEALSGIAARGATAWAAQKDTTK